MRDSASARLNFDSNAVLEATGTSRIGTPFFVMKMVEDRIFCDATFPGVSYTEPAAYFDAMNATIAALHRVDQDAVGLGNYGRPGNYFARQIARWAKQYLKDANAGRDPDMDALIEWLPLTFRRG